MSDSAHNIAIIMDGSRQWAEWHRASEIEALQASWETLKARLGDALDFGIEELTVLPARPRSDCDLIEWIASDISALLDLGVRVCFIGQREKVSAKTNERIALIEAATAANGRITLFLAQNYDGREEIVVAAQTFSDGGESEFSQHLDVPQMHDPDLLIRTFGERRLSGYPVWRCAYSELIFRDEPWPAFNRIALEECLYEFDSRQRRYGARL
jgi:undecaprenyl diphosphate synthase